MRRTRSLGRSRAFVLASVASIAASCRDDGPASGMPVIGGKRFEIAMCGGPLFPVLAPDFDAGAPAFTEYYDDVTSIVADDTIYGRLTIDTAVPRLQIQLYDDGSEGFELDVDHSFKELGNMSVMSTITLP